MRRDTDIVSATGPHRGRIRNDSHSYAYAPNPGCTRTRYIIRLSFVVHQSSFVITL